MKKLIMVLILAAALVAVPVFAAAPAASVAAPAASAAASNTAAPASVAAPNTAPAPAHATHPNYSSGQYILPIIMYHNTHKKSGRFTVTPAQLEKDMIWLLKNGFTAVTLREVIAFKHEGMLLPSKPIMLTFDDGYQNNYYNAYPLFKKYNMKCVMSVVGAWIDQNYRDEVYADTCAHLNYDQIKEMHDSGLVEIQNHTYDMHKTGRRYGLKKIKGEDAEKYKEALKSDLIKNHDRIRDKTGIEMSAVAFPFGAYSRETFEVLHQIGYKAALTCTEGLNKLSKDTDLFLLKRFNRPSGASSEQYFSKILVK